MKRVASLWLPYLATDLMAQINPRWKNHPRATIEERARKLYISAVDARAEAAGVMPNQTVADASALAPGLVTAPGDPAGMARALAGFARWCTRYTPWTTPEGEDGLFLDLTGCSHLHGGEAKLHQDLVTRFQRLGFHARLAIAGTPGAAWAMARHGDTPIVPSGSEATALKSVLIEGLRLPTELSIRLRRLGLDTIGALYTLPRAPLTRRFGKLLTERLDAALNYAPEPISPTPPAPAWRFRRDFAEPIGRPEDVAAALAHLVAELCAALGAMQQGARRLEAALYRADGSVAEIAIGTSRAARNPKHLNRLFAEKCAQLDPMDGADGLVLTASVVEPLDPQQAVFGAGPEASPDFAALVDRLAGRLGEAHVFSLAPVESHAPERAQRRAAPVARGTNLRWPQRVRPLRLLAAPEAIEVTEAQINAPPRQFLWRRCLHEVRAVQGPERIAAEWWRDRPVQREDRDYYRVEDADGQRFWLYRAAAETGSRWYLHGLFA